MVSFAGRRLRSAEVPLRKGAAGTGLQIETCSELPDQDDELLVDLHTIAAERGELVRRRPGGRDAQAGQAARRRHIADARFDNSTDGPGNRIAKLRGSE